MLKLQTKKQASHVTCRTIRVWCRFSPRVYDRIYLLLYNYFLYYILFRHHRHLILTVFVTRLAYFMCIAGVQLDINRRPKIIFQKL
jgi:hypothetical protein